MHPERRRTAAGIKMSGAADFTAGSADSSPGRRISATQLSSIELGLLARFNLEMAEAYDEVAEDPKVRAETRESAQDSASRWRERARLFQFEAQRSGACPRSRGEVPTEERPPLHPGPERRKRERRIRDRRVRDLLPPGALGHAERRLCRDRRQRERRGQIQHVR
jgi:hypothetical protein